MNKHGQEWKEQLKRRLSDEDRTNLADIAWWIKGYRAGNPDSRDFLDAHLNSIRKVMELIADAHADSGPAGPAPF